MPARRPRCAVPPLLFLPQQHHQHSQQQRCVCARAAGKVPLTTQDVLKGKLSQLVTRLNSAAEADDPQLQRELLSVIASLSALTPAPRPAESPLIDGAWALLYTLPGEPKGDVERPPLQQLLAWLYDLFYRYAPILAGSAVGRKAAAPFGGGGGGGGGASGSSSGSSGSGSSQGSSGGGGGATARGQFQIFDTRGRGWVSNQARFTLLGRPGIIQVDGPARVASGGAEGGAGGDRLVATFTEAELRWGDVLR